MSVKKSKGEIQFEFWFHHGHGLLRRPSTSGPFGHPQIWNGRRWAPGSPYDLDSITGMGEDQWSCGEYADRWDLNQATEYAAAHGINLYAKDPDPAPSAEWEVWYRDAFDRECPPKVDVRGYGLVKGLMELWARHLFEGLAGLSHFHLLWKQEKRSIEIGGDQKGSARLRTWMFGKKETTDRGYVAAAEIDLLEAVAIAHANLIVAGMTSAPILEAAAGSPDSVAYLKQVKDLTPRQS
ncbi:MAG TPA: hypothetical protein VKV95_13960 [Terriglobia bacterium]|nr:hypothetical protein [Terriglobia bacterium]